AWFKVKTAMGENDRVEKRWKAPIVPLSAGGPRHHPPGWGMRRVLGHHPGRRQCAMFGYRDRLLRRFGAVCKATIGRGCCVAALAWMALLCSHVGPVAARDV